MFKKKKTYYIFALLIFLIIFLNIRSYRGSILEDYEIIKVKKETFTVDVRTMGELEAAQSISISSSIRGDSGKIIYIVADGTNVNVGDVLVKMDPTPFEEKVEALKNKCIEQEGYVGALMKNLEWEISQAERDEKTSDFEVEAADLELNKVLYGDGPMELSRLKAVMNKAFSKYQELNGYSDDLKALEIEGFLNPAETQNALKKLAEEREIYESASLQYESYSEHVFPMQLKKCEASLKQAKMKKEETTKIRSHAIGRAYIEHDQALHNLESIKTQLADAEKELALSEIVAPAPGMVVHREDFRSGQRRKPRLGDVVLKNQVILDLPDLNFMTIKSKVREIDLCKVEIGKKATIEIDAYPQLKFQGTITSIGVLALPEPGKPSEEKYFEIRILLDQSDVRVRPGMTARVVVHACEVENVVVIPIQSLFHEQKKSYSYVKKAEGFVKREVVYGMSNDEVVEIKEGLNEGDEICLIMPTDYRS